MALRMWLGPPICCHRRSLRWLYTEHFLSLDLLRMKSTRRRPRHQLNPRLSLFTILKNARYGFPLEEISPPVVAPFSEKLLVGV